MYFWRNFLFPPSTAINYVEKILKLFVALKNIAPTFNVCNNVLNVIRALKGSVPTNKQLKARFLRPMGEGGSVP